MGAFDWLWGSGVQTDTSNKPNWVEVDRDGHFYHYLQSVFGSLKGCEAFDPNHSFMFATTLAEIFIPLDIIAERVALCDYRIFNKLTGEEVEKLPTRLGQLLDKPNPFNSFDELVYQIMFSELASGNSYVLTKTPDPTKAGSSYDLITNIWCLNPDVTRPLRKYSIPDPFLVKDKEELLEGYKTHWMVDTNLFCDEVYHNIITKLDDTVRGKSPLISSERNINNLLAVYSARYNVYANNGNAMILTRKTGPQDIAEQINPITRQDMLDDINAKEGIVGRKNFIGISSIPLEAIETLGKIKDLEPFEETFADTIAIGAIYGVDKELLPKKDSTTFTNKEAAEKQLWQNVILPYAQDMAVTLTKAFWLPAEWEFRAITDHVDILKQDEKTYQEAQGFKIDNLNKLLTAGIITPDQYATEMKVELQKVSPQESQASALAKAQTELKGTVGGLSGIISLNAAVATGQLNREVAVQTLVNYYGYADDIANKLITEPTEPATPPTNVIP